MSGPLTLRALKFRAWRLERDEWLVLIFIRNRDDKLELLSEEYHPDEASVQESMRLAQDRLASAVKEAGFPDAEVFAQLPGAKKA